MFETILFYTVFICQIWLLSYYLPQRFIARMELAITRFPASEYPKLYPNGIDHYQKATQWFTLLTRSVLVLGLVAAWLIYKSAEMHDGQVNQMFPWGYFMLQMLPFILLEQSTFKHYRQMRNADSRTSRKADLTPRKLFDFVSPALVGSALLAYLCFVFLALAMHDFNLSLTGKPVLMSLIILSGNLFFAGIIVFLLYGKKLDPYQASEDRMRTIKYTIKALLYVSIGVSIFACAQMAMDKFEMASLQPVLMSFYCQLIALASMLTQLNNIRMEDLNFDVYKQDVSEH